MNLYVSPIDMRPKQHPPHQTSVPEKKTGIKFALILDEKCQNLLK